LTRVVEGDDVPLELDGTTLRLLVQQLVVVNGDRCRTESATFSLQADASRKSWLMRWDYVRDPRKSECAYPRAHVHVNATFADSSPVGRLHIPTGRIPLELVVRHLITEWEVKPRTDDWNAILEESAEGFGD